MTAPAPPRTFLDTPRKSAGIVAALLALLLALSLGGKFFADVRDRARRVADLQALADQQQRTGQFADAWTSLQQAAEAAAEGSALARLIGRGGTQRLALKVAREDLAMAWLESWLPPAKPLPLAAAVAPTLAAGAAAATGARKADLLAHLGWEAALRAGPGAEDASVAAPESFYRQAIDADPANPYAHAYWGHWLAAEEMLGEASSRFEAALASGRARAHVRAVQLAAFQLHNSHAVGAAYIAAVADMIRNREPVDAAVGDRVYTLYAFTFDGEAPFAQLTAALPPTEQIALVRALFVDAADRGRSDRVAMAYSWLARLQEAAGDRDGALASWRAVLAALPPAAPGPLANRARAAVAATHPALLR